MSAPQPTLLAIVELGGYPNFAPLYERLGCRVVVENSMRKALAAVKQHAPKVVVAEFNFQSDFRDRTSSLESLLSTVQRMPHCEVVIFYEQEYAHQLVKLTGQYPVTATLAFPVDEAALKSILIVLA